MRLLISLVAAILAATQALAGPPQSIVFSDLADPLAAAFDDPYKNMGVDLLNELKVLLQLDQKLAQGDLSADERARLQTRRSEAKAKLKANGHDIDSLLAQRWDVARKRRAASIATNPILNGTEVTISGYLIPAHKALDGSNFGYLVSQVGMCSHFPSPPPNQLVRVRLRADQLKRQNLSLYAPVRVSGQLQAERSATVIFILDGMARMLSGWTLVAKTIEPAEELKQVR